MNTTLQAFFKEIATNKPLQQKLFHTKNISDVALIAHEQGFNISPIEILKAQACRLIELATSKPEEAQIATAGKKPTLGAQWGREGTGFLERAGYWLIQLYDWGYEIQSVHSELIHFLILIFQNSVLKSKIEHCNTLNKISTVAQENGFTISAISLLVYQALCIMQLNEQHAICLAQGTLSTLSSD